MQTPAVNPCAGGGVQWRGVVPGGVGLCGRAGDPRVAVDGDGEEGLPEAINTVWSQTVVQTCVIHLLRNSFRYAGRQHWDRISKDLKPVYTAATEAAAKERFNEFAAAWAGQYPAIVRLWENAWAEFVPFLAYAVEIRKVICSTNAIANAFRAGFHLMTHRARPLPVGSRERVTR